MEAILPPAQAALLKTYLQFNASTSGRDKVFRLIQSVTNLYLWNFSSDLEKFERQNLKHLSSSLGTTRSFLKLGNFLNSFDGALKASRLDDSLLRFILTTSKLQSTIQTLFDNLLFLHALGILLLADKSRSRMQSIKTKLSFISSLLSLWRDLYELIRVVDMETKKAGRKRTVSGGGERGTVPEEDRPVLDKSGIRRKAHSRCKEGMVDSPDSGLFHPSLTTASVKDLDWPKFVVFLWRNHFPLCVDVIKNSVDVVVPAKNVGLIKEVNQGFALFCGLVSSVSGLMTTWNPAYRLVPS